jgi:hypothetical protein
MFCSRLNKVIDKLIQMESVLGYGWANNKGKFGRDTYFG